jgi:glycosyltransferase involved in cell wall biosynthesis
MTGRDFYLDPVTTRLSDIIVANSAATAQRFRGSGAGRVRVVHNGVNLEWLREKPIGKPDSMQGHWEVILVVARISKWKRHDLALAAFEHIAPLHPSAHLVCVGAQDLLDSQWWAFLQEKSLRSRYSNRIHWVGPVDDIRPWYRAASLLLLPSTNEPFGRVIVEAMASGVPVVAMRSGGIPEIVRHGEDGLLVSHANGSELGSACLQLLGDAPLRERLAHSSKRRAERFTLEEHVKKMAEVFEEVLG